MRRDTADVRAEVETALNGLRLDDDNNLIAERVSGENPISITLPSGGGGTGDVTTEQFDDLVEDVNQVEAKVDGILSRTTQFSGTIVAAKRDDNTASPDLLFTLPTASAIALGYNLGTYPLRIHVEGVEANVEGFSGTPLPTSGSPSERTGRPEAEARRRSPTPALRQASFHCTGTVLPSVR